MREKNEGGLQEKLVCLLVFSHIEGFPRSSVGKESACNAGDLSSIPGLTACSSMAQKAVCVCVYVHGLNCQGIIWGHSGRV